MRSLRISEFLTIPRDVFLSENPLPLHGRVPLPGMPFPFSLPDQLLLILQNPSQDNLLGGAVLGLFLDIAWQMCMQNSSAGEKRLPPQAGERKLTTQRTGVTTAQLYFIHGPGR